MNKQQASVDVLEGNKLIAEFDDGEFDGREWVFNGQQYKELKYHSSWGWIMPACKKFDTLEISERAKKRRSIYENHCDMIDHAVSCYDIMPVFERLVNAIIWYNTQTKEQ